MRYTAIAAVIILTILLSIAFFNQSIRLALMQPKGTTSSGSLFGVKIGDNKTEVKNILYRKFRRFNIEPGYEFGPYGKCDEIYLARSWPFLELCLNYNSNYVSRISWQVAVYEL